MIVPQGRFARVGCLAKSPDARRAGGRDEKMHLRQMESTSCPKGQLAFRSWQLPRLLSTVYALSGTGRTGFSSPKELISKHATSNSIKKISLHIPFSF